MQLISNKNPSKIIVTTYYPQKSQLDIQSKVMIPNGEEFVEQPVPEQFRTTVTGLKLDTAPLAREG